MYSRRLFGFSKQNIFLKFVVLEKLGKIKEHLNNFANFGKNSTKIIIKILENLLKYLGRSKTYNYEKF